MEWFCNKCNRVYESKKGYCCKTKSEQFDLSKHGRRLIATSNSWIAVEEKWKNDSLFEETVEECIKDGCYSCAIIFNEFVQKLKDRIEEYNE